VVGARKILNAGKKAYKFLSSKQAKGKLDRILQTADDGTFVGPPRTVDVRRLKDVCGPNTKIPRSQLRKILEQFNIEPDILGYLIAFLAGIATVLILILIFTVGKNIKDIIKYINTKYKKLAGKFKKTATDKDAKFIGKQLKAA